LHNTRTKLIIRLPEKPETSEGGISLAIIFVFSRITVPEIPRPFNAYQGSFHAAYSLIEASVASSYLALQTQLLQTPRPQYTALCSSTLQRTTVLGSSSVRAQTNSVGVSDHSGPTTYVCTTCHESIFTPNNPTTPLQIQSSTHSSTIPSLSLSLFSFSLFSFLF